MAQEQSWDNVLCGLVVVLSMAVVDSVFILLSYVLIIRTVIRLGAKGKRLEGSEHLPLSHFCAVLLFFLPMISLSMLHQFGENMPPLVNTLVAYVYWTVAPALNPIIYSIKSKQIRKVMRRFLLGKGKEGKEGGP